MLTSDFLERYAEQIDLPGKKAKEVEVLLNVIYSHGTTQQVSGIIWYIPASCPTGNEAASPIFMCAYDTAGKQREA